MMIDTQEVRPEDEAHRGNDNTRGLAKASEPRRRDFRTVLIVSTFCLALVLLVALNMK